MVFGQFRDGFFFLPFSDFDPDAVRRDVDGVILKVFGPENFRAGQDRFGARSSGERRRRSQTRVALVETIKRRLVLKGDAFGDARRFDFRSDAAERLILMLQIMGNKSQMKDAVEM